jgi:hypothetical protein
MDRSRCAFCLSFFIATLILGCSDNVTEPPPTMQSSAGSNAGRSSTSSGGSAGSTVVARGGAAGASGGGAANIDRGGAPSGYGGSATGGASAGANNQAGSESVGGRAGAASAGGSASGGVNGAVALDPALLSKCTGANPILCSLPVASDGNYTITVELGSSNAASASRVQAETYRIVIPPTSLAAGSYVQQTFSVNVRAEKHDGYSAPGKTLDLRIDGSAPALHGLGVMATPKIPTIFVAGDSTVCDWDPVYTAANSNTAGPL